ncbi:MAG TPA: flagellar biosynthesis protein FlhF, partial [Thiomicrorhabdus sp.]|nr:flagellar biosynthesis protein FlhF [Thiomicrorhabdus sp.]
MKIKRYFAPTMRLAMNLVRKEHGDDAVILSTKDVDGGVEIVVALDPEAMQYQEAHSHQNTVSGSTYQSPETLASPAIGGRGNSQELAGMAAEIQAVKAMLENQLSGLA